MISRDGIGANILHHLVVRGKIPYGPPNGTRNRTRGRLCQKLAQPVIAMQHFRPVMGVGKGD